MNHQRPLFVTNLWKHQVTIGFTDSFQGPLKGKVDRKCVNIYYNCIIRKQKKGIYCKYSISSEKTIL